jgi:hypothetical protein
LENRNIWGKAGQAQKEINAAWSRDIELSGRFEKELQTTDSRKVWADGRMRFYADSGKVKSWLESLGTSGGQTRQQMVRERIASARELLSKIDEYHGLGDEQRAVLTKALDASRDLEGQLSHLDKSVTIANKVEEVMAAERAAAPLVNPLAGRIAGTLTGAVAAGPKGALMGAMGLLAKPGAAMGAADQVHALARRLGVKLEDRAASWVENSVKPPTEGVVARTRGKVARAVAAAGEVAARAEPAARGTAAPVAVKLFMGEHADLGKAYESRASDLIRTQTDPSALFEHVASAVGPLSEQAPGVAAAVLAKSQAAAQYLFDQLPAGTLAPTLLEPARKATVSKVEMMRYAQIWAAVEKPEIVVADLERGMATPSQIKALQAVHPETYAGIRDAVVRSLIEIGRAGKRLPISMRQQLDLLLDLNGAGEPAFSPKVADRILAYSEPQKPPAPKQMTSMAKSFALPQQNWPSAPAKG